MPDIRPDDLVTVPVWWVPPGTQIGECRVLSVLGRELLVKAQGGRGAAIPHYVAVADVCSVNGRAVGAGA